MFLNYIKEDLKERPPTEENINFIIEEIIVINLIRQKLINFSKTLVKNDEWRLIIYPGSYIKSDLYQYKKNVLLNTSKRAVVIFSECVHSGSRSFMVQKTLSLFCLRAVSLRLKLEI